jgi:hypothetical protein
MSNTFFIKSTRSASELLENAIQYLSSKSNLSENEKDDFETFKTGDLENPSIKDRLLYYRTIGDFSKDSVYESTFSEESKCLYDCVDDSFSDYIPLKGIEVEKKIYNMSEYYKFVDDFQIWEDWEFPEDSQKFENYAKNFFAQNPFGFLYIV